MKDTMRFIDMLEAGGPEVLVLSEGEVPRPATGQVRIHVKAAGINRPDMVQRQGLYPPPPGASPVLGLEVSGIVSALGKGVTGFKEGDAVCALVPGGGYAEQVVVPASHCLPKPAALNWIESAAVPETAFTVWNNLFMRAGLREGDTVLVHGGSGGIGTTAIQLASAAGASVFTTVGSAKKRQLCESLGALRAVEYRHEDFVAVVKEQTGGQGVDVILDMLGGDYLPRNQKALALEGRLVMIACMHGRHAELDIMGLMLKRQQVMGSTLRAQPDNAKAAIAEALKARVWPWIDEGRYRPLIHQVFPLQEAAAAHRVMESGAHVGKLVLNVDDR